MMIRITKVIAVVVPVMFGACDLPSMPTGLAVDRGQKNQTGERTVVFSPCTHWFKS